MSDYFQPDFYRFNRDSLELIKWAGFRTKNIKSVLDLGAGCGVIGIELAIIYRPARLDLVELQEDFRPFLESNLRMVPDGTVSNVYFSSFSNWKHPVQYDLIVCNPPYYLPGRGEPSRDLRRGMARSFLRDGWPALLECIRSGLAPDGQAILVLKNEKMLISEVNANLEDLALKGTFFPFEDIVFLELFRLDID